MRKYIKHITWIPLIFGLVLISYDTTKAQITKNQPWAAQVTLAAGDTTKTLLAAPGAGRTTVVTSLACTVGLAAAQVVTVAGGTSTYLVIGASAPLATYFTPDMVYGLAAPVNTAIIITPAAAGPIVFCIAEGYYTTTGV